MPCTTAVRFAPAWRPDVRTSSEVALVSPPAHLPGGAEHIADKCEPIGVGVGGGATLRAVAIDTACEIINCMAGLGINERVPDAPQPISEIRHIDTCAVSIIAIGIECIVAF